MAAPKFAGNQARGRSAGGGDIARQVMIEILGTDKVKPAENALIRIHQHGQTVEKTMVRLNHHTKKWETTMVSATKKTGGFRMELLSVMFFGYMVQRALGGIIMPVMESTGAFEYMSVVLGEMVRPVLEPLSDILWVISDALDEMDPNLKNVIGSGLVLGMVLAFILGLIGSLGLGIMGLKALLPTLAVPALAPFILLGAKILFVAALFLWLYDNLKSFKDNVDAIMRLWARNIGITIDFVREQFEALAKFWEGVFSLDANKMVDGILDGVKSMWKAFERFTQSIIELFSDLWTTVWNQMPDWAKSIFSGIAGAVGTVGKVAGDIVGSIASSIGGVLGYQQGGVVPGVGPQLAVVHGGETIIPAGGSMPINVTINASMSSELDVRRVAGQVAGILRDDLRNR